MYRLRRDRRLLNGESGFSLVEVIISSLVAGTALIGLALMYSNGLAFLIGGGGDVQTALYLAQHKLEQLRAKGFDVLVAGDQTLTSGCVATWPSTTQPSEPCYDEQPIYFYSATLSGGSFTYNSEKQYSNYHRTTRVECVDPNDFSGPGITCPSPPTAKRITVTVTPDMRQGRPVVVQTVLTVH